MSYITLIEYMVALELAPFVAGFLLVILVAWIWRRNGK